MYTQLERRKNQPFVESQNIASLSRTALQENIPNSAMLSMMAGDRSLVSSIDELGDRIRSRQPKIREYAQAQIPRAENEADRLSASVTSGSPESVKMAMGQKMGADFSGVRFHTDAAAAKKAETMGARAYTSGADVYFGEGGFDPSVAAHELVHTAQQGMVDSTTATMSTPAGGVQMCGCMCCSDEDERERLENNALAGDRGELAALMDDETSYTRVRQHVGRILQQHLAEHLEEYRQLNHGNNTIALTENDEITLTPGGDGKYKREDLTKLVGQLTPSKKEMLDPITRDALRNGNIASIKSKDLQAALGDEMNHQIIADTMKLPINLNGDERKMAEQSGRNMAHLMLAMQMGKIKINKTGTTGTRQTSAFGADMPYRPSMASLFAYGGRVHLNFGKSQESRTQGQEPGKVFNAHHVYESMMELDRNELIQDEMDQDEMDQDEPIRDELIRGQWGKKAETSRPLATHHLRWDDAGKNVEHNGRLDASVPALLDGAYEHHGFNPAVGGAGQVGYRSDKNAPANSHTRDGAENINGHIIKADGINGHMYLGVKSSYRDRDGGILAGLETSASGETNLMGKSHNMFAAKAPFSAVGAHKKDIIGDEYNGREVDLTELDMKDQIDIHHTLSDRMTALSNAAKGQPNSGDTTTREEAIAQYNHMMELLSGEQLDEEELAKLLVGEGEGKAEEIAALKAKFLTSRCRGPANGV